MALIIIAAVLLNLQSINVSSPQPEGAEEKKNVSKGVTDFYTAYRMSSTKPFNEDIGDFVVETNPPTTPLSDRLKGMESMQKPTSQRWVGEHKYRSFRAGSTVREAITEFAQREGMQVLWELDKDFIIKNQFQMDNTITGSLAKIARAIDGSFEGEVQAYICPKQRSLVITEEKSPYVDENCTLLEDR
jgi:hypothetical protein